jgi:hypothetical protein
MGHLGTWALRHLGRKNKVEKKHHVRDIAGFNTEMWMVQVADVFKAFIIFQSACDYLQN